MMPSWLTKLLGVLGSLLGAGFAFYIVTNNSCNTYNLPSPSGDPGSGDGTELHDPWETFEGSGKDKAGRDAEFLIAVLTQEYRWKIREHEYLENDRAALVLPGYLRTVPKLKNAKEIIAVGTASQEGGALGEESRADRRADEIIKALRPISGSKKLYKLNLGQHEYSSADDDTAYQRRVIIVGIMNRSEEMSSADLREALLDALSREKRYSFEAVRYSKFTLSEV